MLLKGEEADRWNMTLSNEWGRLAQGNKYGVVAQDAIEFITILQKNSIPILTTRVRIHFETTPLLHHQPNIVYIVQRTTYEVHNDEQTNLWSRTVKQLLPIT